MALYTRATSTLNLLRGLTIVLLVGSAAASYGAAPQASADEDYQKLITATYHQLANTAFFTLSSPDLSTLINEVNGADGKHSPDKVAGLVAANMDIIKKNINAKELPSLLRVLLQNHALNLGKEILEYAKNNGDRFSHAQQQLEFAKYYANQNQWDKAIAHLQTFDLNSDITPKDGDEVNIMVGAALQAKKKHREALPYYKKVKPDSKHYLIAQLDIALVYIRQDWWTDAQITLEDAIKVAGKDDIETVNRLYTVMGFSQLQQGFYRNARDSFRHVKINSAYSNRALLGLGMSALNQEDYAGATNAFRTLKTQDGNDMSVAQAYLLDAFTLTKTKQSETAAAQYSEAINYYGNKAKYYTDLLNNIADNQAPSSSLLATTLDGPIANQNPAIKTLAEKLDSLARLQQYPVSPATLQASASLYARLYKSYQDLVAEAATQKQIVFNSYLNQANFGLTRLYDTP